MASLQHVGLMDMTPIITGKAETAIGIGHNRTPAELIFDEIQDLYDTAKDFCDGIAVNDQDTADALTKIMEDIHDAGKRAESIRVTEKEPHLAAGRAVDALFKPVLDKVKLGKDACAALLAPWRKRLADEAALVARKLREEADAKAAQARAAMQATAGNLAEREKAESLAKEAKQLDKIARKEDAKPTGLVTRWTARIVDEDVALDWAFTRDKTRFIETVQAIADAAVRMGLHTIPGFAVEESKVARV